ncbi:hypoxanthine phosphoribosyltransferase [Echinicola pacifica]|uniref:Hypoxanthine phosphoribosyltransferase n=2 Tax=Echinicola pacifica TaxID=346377 RepID=A0A918PUG8_9BACT|nr:hypoxanthine phosphoribosyltransferase [Echinicola pacifica]
MKFFYICNALNFRAFLLYMLKVRDKEFKLYLSAEELKDRVNQIGAQLSQDYAGKEPVVLGVLNGAFMFLSDLMKAVDTPLEMSFIKISSYESMSSTGKVKEVLGLTGSLAGRHVLVVEDIVDTGLSMAYLINELKAQAPSSVEVVSLLLKPEALTAAVSVKYVGFEIPNKFVVGYGLDYDGYGRNLKEIYQLK